MFPVNNVFRVPSVCLVPTQCPARCSVMSMITSPPLLWRCHELPQPLNYRAAGPRPPSTLHHTIYIIYPGYLQHLHSISTISTHWWKLDKLGCMGRYISDFLIGFPAICKLCCVVSCPYYCCYLLLSAPAQECVQSNYVANSHPALFQQHHSIRENISRLGSARAGRC